MCECALYALPVEFSQPVTQKPFKTPIFQIQWQRQHTQAVGCTACSAWPLLSLHCFFFVSSWQPYNASTRSPVAKHSLLQRPRERWARCCHAIYGMALCHSLVFGVYVRHSPDILRVEPHPLDLHFHSVSHVIACIHTHRA